MQSITCHFLWPHWCTQNQSRNCSKLSCSLGEFLRGISGTEICWNLVKKFPHTVICALILLNLMRHWKSYKWVADFPNPAQPHETSSVCTAARRNTGNRGNSIIASCAGVPTPPHRTRHSIHAKGSAAYLSWLNEDGGHDHTLDLHWESAE